MVKRLRLSPLTAATRVRIPAESPKCASARCAFFHAGIQTRVRVLLCNPHPVHARVPRHFRVSSSPIGARCKANPGRVTITAHWYAPFFVCRDSPRVTLLFARCYPVHAVVFRARFAARHDSRLGQYFCALSRLMSLAYRQVSFVPFGAKFSQNSLPDTSWSRLNSVALKELFNADVSSSLVGVVCEADPGRVPRRRQSCDALFLSSFAGRVSCDVLKVIALPDTSWSRLNSVALKGTFHCGCLVIPCRSCLRSGSRQSASEAAKL